MHGNIMNSQMHGRAGAANHAAAMNSEKSLKQNNQQNGV